MSHNSDINHGTTSAYQYHKCRCSLCKEAQRKYMHTYRQKPGNKSRLATNSYELRKQYAWQWIKENRPDIANEIRQKVQKKETL